MRGECYSISICIGLYDGCKSSCPSARTTGECLLSVFQGSCCSVQTEQSYIAGLRRAYLLAGRMEWLMLRPSCWNALGTLQELSTCMSAASSAATPALWTRLYRASCSCPMLEALAAGVSAPSVMLSSCDPHRQPLFCHKSSGATHMLLSCCT